jgi:Zn-dependent alcohol dehydrogenase
MSDSKIRPIFSFFKALNVKQDILLQKGLFGGACTYPAIFGHEGAGVVREIGSNVRDKTINVGDAVLLSFTVCGNCERCKEGHPAECWNFIECNFSARRYSDKTAAARTLDGRPVGANFFGHSSFAKLSVVHDRCVVKYPYDDIENIGLYAGVCQPESPFFSCVHARNNKCNVTYREDADSRQVQAPFSTY